MSDLDVNSMEYLNTVSIETASRCNLKCKMCSHPTNERNSHFMGTDEFKTIIDRLLETKIRRVLFNMGEPLMNKDLFRMVTYAKDKGFFIYISTNGQLLSEKAINRVLDTGVDALKVSVEGCTPEVYEKIRIGGNFDRLFRNVVRLHELKTRRGSPLYSWISTVLMKGNEDIVEFVKFWGPYCDDIELSGMTDHIGLVESNKDISLTDKWTHRKNCPQIKPFKELNVLSNGDMVLCCVDFHARCKLGNLLTDDLNDIWQSEKMTAIRTKAYSGQIPDIDPCRQCHICDYSGLLNDSLQTVGALLHRMVKNKRWSVLDKVRTVKEPGAVCTACGSLLKISFDGICLDCLKKEPYYSRFVAPRQLKVMVAGDSFGMPRPFKMTNDIEMHYQDCYPQQLERMLNRHFQDSDVTVINYCKRANTSLGVLYDLKNPRFGEIYLSQPDYLVIQVGNVDCFERTRHHDEFAPFPEMRGKNPWIACDDFIKIMAEAIKGTILAVPGLKGILIVNIPPIKKEDNKRNTATRKRIALYNKQLKMFDSLANIHVLDLYKLFYRSAEDPLSSDGIHPNTYGSKLLAELIFEKIKEKINEKD